MMKGEGAWSQTTRPQSASVKRGASSMFNFAKKKKVSVDDFEPMRNLGEGAYGEVILVRHKATDKLYAMKVLDKQHISKERKEKAVLVEKQALALLSHPNFVKLHFSFQVSFALSKQD